MRTRARIQAREGGAGSARGRGEWVEWAECYVHYTPSQGSANRSASEGVLGAMARPAPVSPLFITVLPPPKFTIPPILTATH